MERAYNIAIALKILDLVREDRNKDLRFGQLLVNYNILQYVEEKPRDIYNDESSQIYSRISASVSR